MGNELFSLRYRILRLHDSDASNLNESSHWSDKSERQFCPHSRPLFKARCSQTREIRYRPHFVLISRSYQNPPSPNELLSKGCSFADIKASGEASRKTYVCIALKQRDNSRKYGLVCYLGKQMAEEVGFEPTERVNVRWFSRPVHSTTLPLLQS